MDQHDVNARLSRLETIIDNMSHVLEVIQRKLDNQNKINWAPVGIGVTLFLTVVGSFATIYNARINTINNAVETLANRTVEVEKGAVGRDLRIGSHDGEIIRLQQDVEKLDDRVREIEKKTD